MIDSVKRWVGGIASVALASTWSCSPGAPTCYDPRLPVPGRKTIVSNDLLRPGAIIIDDLLEGGTRLPPRVVCSADQSIGRITAFDKFPVTESAIGAISSNYDQSFKANAEARFFGIVASKVKAGTKIKITTKLTNARVLEIPTASLTGRLCRGLREPECSYEIDQSSDKLKRSIIVGVVVADLVLEARNEGTTDGSVGVNMSEVAAELGSQYEVASDRAIRGKDLTVAYQTVSDDRFIWEQDLVKNCPKPEPCDPRKLDGNCTEANGDCSSCTKCSVPVDKSFGGVYETSSRGLKTSGVLEAGCRNMQRGRIKAEARLRVNVPLTSAFSGWWNATVETHVNVTMGDRSQRAEGKATPDESARGQSAESSALINGLVESADGAVQVRLQDVWCRRGDTAIPASCDIVAPSVVTFTAIPD